MDRAEKQAEIAALGQNFAGSQIAVCADYRGLTVAEITTLRSELRAVGSYGRVVKNTLAKIAAEKAFKEAEGNELGKFLDIFQGPNFIVFSEDDPVAPAKVVSKFAKEHEHLEIKGGWFEGAFVDESGVKALSSLPSREELIAQLLRLMNAPATQLVRLMQAPAQQTVQVLEAHRANLEKQG